MIDTDVAEFTVDLLLVWKSQAEAAARLALQRRGLEERDVDRFARLVPLMSPLLEEMAADLRSDIGTKELARDFVPMRSKGNVFNSDAPIFAYYIEEHPYLLNAVKMLEDAGFVRDVTPRRTPIYRMDDVFVDLLLAMYPTAD